MEYPTYQEILDRSVGGEVTYEELLQTKEWKELRDRILKRDGNRCIQCDKPPTTPKHGDHWRDYTEEEIKEQRIIAEAEQVILNSGAELKMKRPAVSIGGPVGSPLYLHVHHRYYVFRNLPWEYPDDAFSTLCHQCHYTLHENEAVPVYTDESLSKAMDFTPCTRCYGTGYFPEFKHVKGGVCFRCHGALYEELINRT